MQVFTWRNICEKLLKAVSFTDCQQCIHMWNCAVEKLCVKLSHGVQSSLRTTHQLGAIFTNMFTEPANDPWTCVHCSGSCLLSTTGPLPLVFAIFSLAMAWIPFIIAYCYMVGPFYWRWGHGSSQGGASIVDNNSISVLSTWWADYIHRQRHHIIHCSAGSLVSVMLWWTTGPKWVVVQHGSGRHVDQQCKAGCAQYGKVTSQLGKVCLFVFTFSVHVHSLWTYILVNKIFWAALSPLSSTRALN